jgi:hypothetical protein
MKLQDGDEDEHQTRKSEDAMKSVNTLNVKLIQEAMALAQDMSEPAHKLAILKQCTNNLAFR